MAENEARSVRPRAGRPRRKPREVTWEEMTPYQRMLVEAGKTSAGEVPPGMTLDQFREWLRRLERKA